MRIGILPLGRPTFDVPFAQEMLADAMKLLASTGHDLIGGNELLFDAPAAEVALKALSSQKLDLMILMQVTFTDASMTVKIAKSTNVPIGLWAFPELRSGGRLRLNSYCGLNLAAHALHRVAKPFRWVYATPTPDALPQVLDALMAGDARDVAYPLGPKPTISDQFLAKTAIEKLKGRKIGLIGEHPVGFDTCNYDTALLDKLLHVSVDKIALPALFDRARAVPAATIAATNATMQIATSGLNEVNQAELAKSFSVYHALSGLAEEGGYGALAVRCWPEMFTEYGCAACGPMGMLNEKLIPCACEADVYGALTNLILQGLAEQPSFLVDIVDMDSASNTGVVWHCGLAPVSMHDPETPPMAQIHSNRKMPLLQEFALKPGRVTVARLSQAQNKPVMVIAGAEMLRAPKSFTGTSGVIRFDRPIDDVTDTMLEMGLEHHVSIVYGDVRGALRALAANLSLPVVELA
jgi:L-fucose isomerase-like protein